MSGLRTNCVGSRRQPGGGSRFLCAGRGGSAEEEKEEAGTRLPLLLLLLRGWRRGGCTGGGGGGGGGCVLLLQQGRGGNADDAGRAFSNRVFNTGTTLPAGAGLLPRAAGRGGSAEAGLPPLRAANIRGLSIVWLAASATLFAHTPAVDAAVAVRNVSLHRALTTFQRFGL